MSVTPPRDDSQVLSRLVGEGCTSATAFTWASQLRCRWEEEAEVESRSLRGRAAALKGDGGNLHVTIGEYNRQKQTRA